MLFKIVFVWCVCIVHSGFLIRIALQESKVKLAKIFLAKTIFKNHLRLSLGKIKEFLSWNVPKLRIWIKVAAVYENWHWKKVLLFHILINLLCLNYVLLHNRPKYFCKQESRGWNSRKNKKFWGSNWVFAQNHEAEKIKIFL